METRREDRIVYPLLKDGEQVELMKWGFKVVELIRISQ
jgi:hypothetical protein